MGGIEVLADTLSDEDVPSSVTSSCDTSGSGGSRVVNGCTEEEKSEAAGLLAQVTSPWIENNTRILGLIKHLENLVESLTGENGVNMFEEILGSKSVGRNWIQIVEAIIA